jgi:hypothetical protein
MIMHHTAQWKSLLNEADSYYASVTEPERALMRDWVKGLLQEREVTVDFVKADGEFRSMKCTLSEDLGAKYTKKNATENTRKPNLDTCVVWDLNRQAWRSFRWDRMKRIQFDLG